ncbi:MAG: cyclase family protein [Pirellulales bacterium]
MRAFACTAVLAGLVGSFALGWMLAHPSAHGQAQDEPPTLKGWTKGKGWGPWGKNDEVGALNAMSADSVKAALGLVRDGEVYDLGVNYDAESFKWPGHSPGAIMTFRGPEGVKRQGDFKPVADRALNPDGVAWHSCALFISDNVGTQIDGLAHITAGEENAWYNGFEERDWGGNFGVRKCDATTIPPIITRGVLLDVAGFRKVDALPAHYRITSADLRATAEAQKVKLRPGDTVLIRTGTLRHWGANGSDHKTIGEHDSAGIDLEAAKWLVEEQGAILIGSDTSGLEWTPGPMESAGGFIPVHRYLLIEQGVHIGEFHNLEELARQRVYEFCYICTTAKIRGATAGFALRPIAIR